MSSHHVSARTDPFFFRQPEKAFVEELKKPLHTQKPLSFGSRQQESHEVSLEGLYLDIAFPDPEGLGGCRCGRAANQPSRSPHFCTPKWAA